MSSNEEERGDGEGKEKEGEEEQEEEEEEESSVDAPPPNEDDKKDPWEGNPKWNTRTNTPTKQSVTLSIWKTFK